MVADLCHVVLSCFRGEKAKRRHAKTRQMVTYSCFRMATFRPATRKYDTFHASPFCLLFVVSLPGGFSRGDLSPLQAKIRQTGAKRRKVATRKPAKWWLFRVFAWWHFAPPHESTRHSMRFVFGYCLSYLCLARRKVATRKPDEIAFWGVFAWRPFAFSPRKHVYTTWYKSATIRCQYSNTATEGCCKLCIPPPRCRNWRASFALCGRALSCMSTGGPFNAINGTRKGRRTYPYA